MTSTEISGPWLVVAVLAYLAWAVFLAADTIRRSGNVPLAVFVIVVPVAFVGWLLFDRRRRHRAAVDDPGAQDPVQ